MAGHSKWANIQHRKKAQDSKRGKVFTKLIREITIAARMGGADINANPRLRLAVDKALSLNMSKDTIERAKQKGAGGLEGQELIEIRYEGYGPAGVAVLVYTMTDNRNRTVGEVRHAFTKCGGSLGTDGSVSYLFQERGIITFPPKSDENRVMEIGLEAGAEDIVNNDDGSIDIFTTPELFNPVNDAFIKNKLNAVQAEVSMIPNIYVNVDAENAENVLKLQEMLEDLDDVQNVYTNADIAQDILEKL